MNSHKNAPLTPKGREAMVRSVIEGGLTKAAAAGQFNTTAKTVAKGWLQVIDPLSIAEDPECQYLTQLKEAVEAKAS